MAAPSTPPEAPSSAAPTPAQSRKERSESEHFWRTSGTALVLGGCSAIVAALVAGLVALRSDDRAAGAEGDLPSATARIVTLVTILIMVILVAYGLFWTPPGGERRRADEAQQDLQEAEEQLAEADQLALTALWDVTHKRLNYYH
jgi:hypothetical protein